MCIFMLMFLLVLFHVLGSWKWTDAQHEASWVSIVAHFTSGIVSSLAVPLKWLFQLIEAFTVDCQMVCCLMEVFLKGLPTHLCLCKEGYLFTIMHSHHCELLDSAASAYRPTVCWTLDWLPQIVRLFESLGPLSFSSEYFLVYLPPSLFLLSICCV